MSANSYAEVGEFLRHCLGHVANAFGSCCKRIWVMLQTHLGHVDNFKGNATDPLTNHNENAAFYMSESGLYLRGSGVKIIPLPRIRRSGVKKSPLLRIRRVSSVRF